MNYDPYTGEPIRPAPDPSQAAPAGETPSPEPEGTTGSVRFRVPPEEQKTVLNYVWRRPILRTILFTVLALFANFVLLIVWAVNDGNAYLGIVLFILLPLAVLATGVAFLIYFASGKGRMRRELEVREYSYVFYADRLVCTMRDNGVPAASETVLLDGIERQEIEGNYRFLRRGRRVWFIRLAPNGVQPAPSSPSVNAAPEPAPEPAPAGETPAPTAGNFDPYTGEPIRPAPDPSQAAPAGTDGAAATPAPFAPETDPTAPGAPPAGVSAKRPKAPMVLLILSVLSLAVLQYLFVMGITVAGLAGHPFPFLFPLLLLPLPVATVIVGARNRQKDKRYRSAMVGGTVIAVLVLLAATGAGLAGILSGHSRRAEAAKADAVLDEYRSVVGFEVPKADFTNFRDDAAEDGYADNDTLIRVQRYADFEFDNTETAEQLLAAAEASGLWLEPLPNSLRGVYAGSWDYGSDEEGIEHHVLSMIYDPETGKFNTLPEQPGVYRYVSFELSVTRDTTGRRPTAYAHFSVRECVVNYVG